MFSPQLFIVVLTILATSVFGQDNGIERTATATSWTFDGTSDSPCKPSSPFFSVAGGDYVRLPADQYVNTRFGAAPDRCATCIKVTSVGAKESVVVRLAESRADNKQGFLLSEGGYNKIKLNKDSEMHNHGTDFKYHHSACFWYDDKRSWQHDDQSDQQWDNYWDFAYNWQHDHLIYNSKHAQCEYAH
ncbi:hypothetical protein HDV05_005190 [Chytridiales sp. JEL 0842]|nr:hypothetical protein HDV05_005190 [Chytridiales sp. JEL 0842]